MTCILAASPILLQDRELDARHLWQTHTALDALAWLVDGEHILQTGGKRVASGILDVNDVEGPWVLLNVHHLAHTPRVTALDHHDDRADLGRNALHDLARLDVEDNGVAHLDRWVRVADGAAVMGHNVRDLLGRQ